MASGLCVALGDALGFGWGLGDDARIGFGGGRVGSGKEEKGRNEDACSRVGTRNTYLLNIFLARWIRGIRRFDDAVC